MRNELEIKNLLLDFAKQDERVRAVLLNGSRANPSVKPDKYQDFDIVYIVTNFESFIANHSWTAIFGKKIIWQLPNEMGFGDDETGCSFAYLMQLIDGNRIDLTLFPVEHLKTDFVFDSLTIMWLDKDNLFAAISQPTDRDYHIKRPTEKEFLDVCNEFWWVSIYVAKGLLRSEMTYAKDMLETVVRPMFMKMIGWKIGFENNFAVSFGKSGKFMAKYLTSDHYNKILQTYSDADKDNNWKSLFIITELFEQASNETSTHLKFNQNREEQQNVMAYLKQLYNDQKKYSQQSAILNCGS